MGLKGTTRNLGPAERACKEEPELLGYIPGSHHPLWTGYDTSPHFNDFLLFYGRVPLCWEALSILFLLQGEAKGLGSWVHSTPHTTQASQLLLQWSTRTLLGPESVLLPFPAPLHPADITKKPSTLLLLSKHLPIFATFASAGITFADEK